MSTSGETHLKTLSLQSQTHYTKLTTLFEDWYRLYTWSLHVHCIHGSKRIHLNEYLADIDEFSTYEHIFKRMLFVRSLHKKWHKIFILIYTLHT